MQCRHGIAGNDSLSSWQCEGYKDALSLFEDQDLQLEEQKTLYRKKAEHKIEKKKSDEGMKKAGKILIISDMDVEKQEIGHVFVAFLSLYILCKREQFLKKVLDLDDALGLYMFPKKVRS